jgi:hypothetical protein
MASVDRLKKPKNAYLLFCDEERPKIWRDFPNLSFTEKGALLGQRWREQVSKEKKKEFDVKSRPGFEASHRIKKKIRKEEKRQRRKEKEHKAYDSDSDSDEEYASSSHKKKRSSSYKKNSHKKHASSHKKHHSNKNHHSGKKHTRKRHSHDNSPAVDATADLLSQLKVHTAEQLGATTSIDGKYKALSSDAILHMIDTAWKKAVHTQGSIVKHSTHVNGTNSNVKHSGQDKKVSPASATSIESDESEEDTSSEEEVHTRPPQKSAASKQNQAHKQQSESSSSEEDSD